MSDFIQHIIIDDTLKRIGETAFADYLCHAYFSVALSSFRSQPTKSAWLRTLTSLTSN